MLGVENESIISPPHYDREQRIHPLLGKVLGSYSQLPPFSLSGGEWNEMNLVLFVYFCTKGKKTVEFPKVHEVMEPKESFTLPMYSTIWYLGNLSCPLTVYGFQRP